MSNQFRDYTPPNPFSFGNTVRMEQQIRTEKENFKREELEKELKHEKI